MLIILIDAFSEIEAGLAEATFLPGEVKGGHFPHRIPQPDSACGVQPQGSRRLWQHPAHRDAEHRKQHHRRAHPQGTIGLILESKQYSHSAHLHLRPADGDPACRVPLRPRPFPVESSDSDAAPRRVLPLHLERRQPAAHPDKQSDD
jgi:hypothetical protein